MLNLIDPAASPAAILAELRERLAPDTGDLDLRLDELQGPTVTLHPIREWWQPRSWDFLMSNGKISGGRWTARPGGVASEFPRVPDPLDLFDPTPALHDAPDSPPADMSATAWFVRCDVQADLWRAARQHSDSPDARRNARAWADLRAAAEAPATDELRRIVGVLNHVADEASAARTRRKALLWH